MYIYIMLIYIIIYITIIYYIYIHHAYEVGYFSWTFLFATTGWMRFSQTDHAPQRGFWPIPTLGDIGFTHSMDMVGYRWFWMILELDDVGSSWMILDLGFTQSETKIIQYPYHGDPWWLAKQHLFLLRFQGMFLSLPYLKRFIRSEWNP